MRRLFDRPLFVGALLFGFVGGIIGATLPLSSQPSNPGVTTSGAVALNDCTAFVDANTIKSVGSSCAGTSPVSSVFARTGAVVAAANDYAIGQISGLATGIATFLGAPSSANLAAALTDETGSGLVVFATNGPWTPTVTTSGTVGTPSYNVQVGSYEQVGRQVTARFFIGLGSWAGSPTGNISVGNLPVPSANTTNDYGTCTISNYSVTALAALNYGLSGQVTPGTSDALIFSNGATGANNVTAAQAGATLLLIGACFYHV